MQDLIDGIDPSNSDRVTGYTIKQIEDVLHNSSSWNEWRDNIKKTYPSNSTKNHVDALFAYWDKK